VSGVIESVSCDYNTHVTKGQVCAKLDPRPYQTVVDQDRANLEAARAQLDKDRTNLQYAQVTYQRNADLAKNGIVSQDVVDQAKSAADQARAQVELDQTAIVQHQAALKAAEVNLGYTTIASPVEGTVVSRNVTPGQTVAASFQTPTLFLIATDLTRMQVDTNVSESDIGGITNGERASFTVEAFPDQTFDGMVTQVRQAPQTVQNVVTYDVVVSVPNPDQQLKPGMTATVHVVTAERDNVIRVPDQALRYTPGGVSGAVQSGERVKPVGTSGGGASEPGFVWVLRNGRPVRVSVTVGLDDDMNAEIVAGGLQPGDEVIESEQTGQAGSRRSGSSAPRLRF
jgi:HlyD family secretion protein